jgi:tetratricopeptide (TPR) repeat protein
MRFLICIVIVVATVTLNAQQNCNVFEGACREACERYVKSERLNQGSFRAHEVYDSAIALCPTFAFAHHEKSVGYLKNGEFLLWRKYMDEAVKHNPGSYLPNRGWCRFKFLHDYEGALADLSEARRINNGFLGWSGDGDYDLELMVALCHRELKRTDTALHLMKIYFQSKETGKNNLGVGIYDYLHYGVTLLSAGYTNEAIMAFQKQIGVYKQLPDTYYYLAVINKQQGDVEKYKENLNLAHDYFVKGYNRKDPYCEALDEVYLSVIKKELDSQN